MHECSKIRHWNHLPNPPPLSAEKNLLPACYYSDKEESKEIEEKSAKFLMYQWF